jgi:hypothetical protein
MITNNNPDHLSLPTFLVHHPFNGCGICTVDQTGVDLTPAGVCVRRTPSTGRECLLAGLCCGRLEVETLPLTNLYLRR